MYPLAIIDFEATSLDRDSVPIEVGIAFAGSASAPVHTWSALICPSERWNMRALWDPDAARVHGIRLQDLQGGIAPRMAVEHMNALLRGVTQVWCGDEKYDRLWFGRLCEAASPVAPVFGILPIARLLVTHAGACERFNTARMAAVPPHRAGPDAEQLCCLVRHAFSPT